MSGRISPFGDRAYLLEGRSDAEAGGRATAWCLAVATAVLAELPEATVVPGLASVLVSFDALPVDRAALLGRLTRAVDEAESTAGAQAGSVTQIRTHELPARYDGADLAEVAGVLGVSPEALVTRHAAATWVVAAVGFSPGFGYLVSDDAAFSEVPRRADPRPRVPAGAIALAAGMCAVYPSSTPGGWQLIGHTDVPLFDASADPPTRLVVGDVVRFVPVPAGS